MEMNEQGVEKAVENEKKKILEFSQCIIQKETKHVPPLITLASHPALSATAQAPARLSCLPLARWFHLPLVPCLLMPLSI